LGLRGGPSIRRWVGIDKNPRTRVNFQIRVPEVRVVSSSGEQLGVMPTDKAVALADEEGLDLVEVSPTARPPVCRIMDYGKFKYQQSKKLQEAKKKQVQVQLKEVKLRPKTDEHDLQFKINHILRFLEEGNKAKVTLVFRGREITHMEFGKKSLDKIVEAIKDVAVIEVMPKMEGRSMFMIVAPKAKK
jgi:translation initiation factor IF-3